MPYVFKRRCLKNTALISSKTDISEKKPLKVTTLSDSFGHPASPFEYLKERLCKIYLHLT